MIHQFIFAYPRPGMTEAEFQRYWVEEHAVRYASRIPQIRKYLVDTRIPLPGETGDPLWSGVAEIWLTNEREQLESLQTPEFLEGARRDEPNWAAFWRTVGLDTTAHELVRGPGEVRDNTMAKLLVLSKRKAGMALDEFRSYMLGPHASCVEEVPGLRRYQVGLVNDGFYAIGESILDCVEQLWFDDVDSALAAQESAQMKAADADYANCAESRYIHRLLVREHWIIGPELRPYPPVSAAAGSAGAAGAR